MQIQICFTSFRGFCFVFCFCFLFFFLSSLDIVFIGKMKFSMDKWYFGNWSTFLLKLTYNVITIVYILHWLAIIRFHWNAWMCRVYNWGIWLLWFYKRVLGKASWVTSVFIWDCWCHSIHDRRWCENCTPQSKNAVSAF